MIDRKWIWDIDNLLNCLRGIFVFFGPSCITISSIRQRCLRSQKVHGSSWNYQGQITKSCIPIFVVENTQQVKTRIKVDRSIWIIARSPRIYYSISIIYETSPYDWWLYLCLFSFLSFPLRYVVSRQWLRCECFLLTKLIYFY